MDDTPDHYTVAQAAAELGTTERRLRRILGLPQYAARTETITRQTKTGTRTALVMPAALLEEIRVLIETEPNPNAGAAGANAAGESVPLSEPGRMVLTKTEAALSQSLVQAQENIEYLRKENEALRELLAEALRRVPVPGSEEQEKAAEPEKVAPPWWMWWKRG